uniref:Polycomb group RING finger protein 4 n=1 Tax=Rhipicephalus appendiculatus TaxID=34631 RepID=A0A131YX31_RHIAP
MAAPQQGRGAPPGSAAASGVRPDVVGLNPCLTCKLCKGYLVDAMTLVKCLHSFCRSCILKHLETGHACPVCDLRLSKINMESHLIKDDTLQNVVYKAVPGLYQKEMKRRRDFYASKGSKADQASLSPEQKGELDSSSSGRIIFSPDEAVSLSLEYKPIVDVKTEPEASPAGPSSQAFKEPTKRYLNCPAAVTIALLQKFLRMKYSISARYKVDILYMDDVLWSHYMLMDVAYIYSWKRDMPLRLFYRVFESALKPPAPLASTVRVPTSTPSLAQSKDQQSGGVSPCIASGIDARGPTLSKSASVTQESRGCKKETTTPNAAAKTVECVPPVTQSASSKPSNEASGTSIADPKVQSKIDSPPPTRTTNLASVTGVSVESKPTKTVTSTPSIAAVQACSVQRKVPDISDASKPCTPTTAVPASLTTKGPSVAGAVNTVATTTASTSPTKKPETASVPNESAAASKEAKALAPNEPASCPLAKVPASFTKSVVVENVNSQKVTPHVVTVAPSARQGAGCKPVRVCESTLTFKASPDSGSSARTAGFVMKYQPKVVTPSLNGIDKGLVDGLVKGAIHAGDVACDQVTKKDTVVEDVGAVLTSSTLANSPPTSSEDKSVEDKMPETKELQTCISRAALKAEEKMNAMKAAAALVKESGPSEKECTESSSGGLSITLRPNRISVRSHSDDSADKRPRKTSQGDSSPKSEPPASKPPCRSATPPLPVIPSYLTLSKSHPSLFHASPRKRGRPKLATVNSLNEEIERAHMMARGEMAAAAEKPVPRVETTAEKPKPVIPVITSLKIKPIPPPPPPQQPEVLSLPNAPDVPKDPQLRPRSKSQGDISEGKSSDTEDSIGRRKSKRKRPPAEQLKTMVTQLKELSLEKVQVATQEPLQSLSGKGTPKPEQGPEKITLRVTRDEKCILKVEKQLRPAVVSETLHDSGFCEDVVADSLASSPVPPKPKSVSIAAARTTQHIAARAVSSTTSKGLEQIGATRHLQHGTKRDMRKSKRKSVEDWVNEQSKWVRTHEAEAVRQQDVVPPHAKTDRSSKDAPSVPPASSESKETSTKGQRRGRKRTNPVKITKPGPTVDTQQDKPVSSPARVSSSSAEAAAISQALPAAEKESGAEAGYKVNTHSPRNSGGNRNRQEPPPEHPKKSPELVIPRYIPNAATSVPLTVTHARNKRLRESRQEASAASCLDLTSSPSGRGASTESPEKDSEKSKFFKEALNLSMKEAEMPAASCKDACATSVSRPKNPEESAGTPCRDMHGTLAAAFDNSKTVTKSLEQAPPNHGTTSQLSIIHQVVEKIASRNSCKLPKSEQEVVDKNPAATEGENQTNCGSGKKCNPQEDSCSSRSPSSGQPGSLGDSQGADRSIKFDTLASSLGAAVGAKAGSNTIAGPEEMQLSEQSPKSAQAFSNTLQSSAVGSEILPRINETGVFRLEFPAAELSAPSEPRNSKEVSSAVAPSSNSVERQSRSSSLVGKEMSESLRNIVLVQESMMELRQGASRTGSCGSVEAQAKDNASAAEKLSRTNNFPPKVKSPMLENCLAPSIKKEISSGSNNVFTPSSMHSRPQFPNVQFPAGDVKSAREIGGMVSSAAACLNEVFSGSSKPCVRSKSAELIVKSPPENRLSPVFGNMPILKIPGLVERESSDPSKLQSTHVRSMRCRVRSPLGLEVKSPSPKAQAGIGSCAMQDKPSPAKSPMATEVKIVNHMGHTPADVCGVSTVQRAPRPVRSPVSMDVNTTSHCISGSPVRTTDTKVGKLPQERGLWRPIDICTSRQLTEAALQKIAANKSISIGQVKDKRPQVPCRNRPGVAQVPQSLSVSIVTCNAGLKGSYVHQENQITRVSQPLEGLSIPRQSSLSNRQQADFLVKEALPSPHCLDASNSKFQGCSTLLLRAHPELSVTSRSEFKSGIHIPASLSNYTSAQQKSNLSPPPCKSMTLPAKERLSPRLSVESEQPRLSPRPSDRVSGRTSAKDVCQPEGISSSNEVLTGKPGVRKESGMPSPRASENMYRTTVAEIDLFTTLSIIETMKGRATVHDIIDEYITNIGSFFCIMESLPAEGRHVAEVVCSLKEKSLLKVTALLKKVTNKLSSGQLSRALAVEALVQRFLQRCRRDHAGTSAAALTSGEDIVTSSGWGTSCAVSALCEQNVEDMKDEPPSVVVPGFEFAVVPILDVHLRNTELKRKALKRLKYGLRLRDLVGLKRKHTSSIILPSEEHVCRRFAPRRPGGCFPRWSAPRQVKKGSFVLQPATSVHLLTKSLARLLPVASFGLPQSAVIARALSSSLTGLSSNLVNCNVPRNGQCCPFVLTQPVTTPAKAASLALQTYREPGAARNIENILSALSLFVSGQLDGVTSHVPQVVSSHFPGGGSVIIPYTRHRRSSDGLHLSRNVLLVEATSESSLVISSPQSNSKLVIGPDFDRQLLSRLLDGLKFTIPKTQDAAGSWLSSVMRGASGHGSGRMLTNHVNAPEQGWSATKAISSVKREPTAQLKQFTRPELLAKRELLVKPKVPLSRRLLQKRGAPATGVCEVSPVQKRRRSAGAPMPGVVAEVCSATAQRQPLVNAHLPSKDMGKVVPKDCVVVLHRLELRNVEETMLKKRRESGGARPKKKPKLSPLPKAPSCVER